MTLKTILHVDGRQLHLGRKVPRARHYGLRLGNYLDLDQIALPEAVDYTKDASACLGEMLLNDRLGDCGPAYCFHQEGVWQGNAGKPSIKFANSQVEKFYSGEAGYIPSKPATDQGSDLVTMLNYWQQHGLYKDGHKLVGHTQVDGTNWQQVMAAIYLFEGVCFGVSLPDAWVNPAPSGPGWTWDVAGNPDQNNGHCFGGFGFDKATEIVPMSSWGMIGSITRAAIAKYTTFAAGGELHALLSYDALDKASSKAPNGLAADELLADLKKLGAVA